MGLISEQAKVLQTINGPTGRQPIRNTDLDMVHAVFGSKRLNDDFSKRVTEALKNWNKKGYKTDVSNINVRIKVQGGQIVTTSSCDIIQSTDGVSYNEFTTRGSIGADYDTRHDQQVRGLVDRLKNYFGGNAKQVGKTFELSFKLSGKIIYCRQSFFVASDVRNQTTQPSNQQGQQTTQPSNQQGLVKKTIQGKDLTDFRNKIRTETANKGINLKNVEINMDKFTLSYEEGEKIPAIVRLTLAFNLPQDGNSCPSCEAIKNSNKYQLLKEGKFENNTRIYNLFAIFFDR